MRTGYDVHTPSAKKLVEQAMQRMHPHVEQSILREDGLIKGNLGKVLYYAGLYKYYADARFLAEAQELLQGVLARVNKGPGSIRQSTALSRGASGLGMMLCVLEQEGILGQSEHLQRYLSGVDNALYQQSLGQIREGNLDYLHSSVGTLNFLTRRIAHNGRVREYLDHLVSALAEVAVADERGMCFRNVRNSRGEGPEAVNFGTAHGLTGILLTLLNVYEAGIARDQVRHMVGQTIRFMLHYKRNPAELPPLANLLPSTILEDQEWNHPANYVRYEAFPGWCYGDLGPARLLYRAADLLGNDEWRRIAGEIGFHNLGRFDMAPGLQGAFFCHGSAGIAQMYRRLYEVSRVPEYLEGYHFWLGNTIDRIPGEVESSAFVERAGELLFGWAGVGLVLLSALLEEDYSWDSAFLLS